MPNSSYNTFEPVLRYYGIFQPEEKYKIICPFHGDVNASLEINQQKHFWYCYGCGKHGNEIDLIKEFEKLKGKKVSDLQANIKAKKIIGKQYNNIYNIIYNNNNNISSVDISYKQGIDIARDYYFNLPKTNWFKPNGEEEIIQIRNYMNKRGFKNKTLMEANAKATYNKLYSICFPIYDNGIFRGYVMRTIDPEIEQKRKYMYNKGFRRERTLAGTYNTKTLVLVEGFLDKVKANQIGIENVAAILGWKITNTQLKKIQRKRIKTIICALDNDECGRKGYKYLQFVSKTFGFEVKRIHYPKGIKDMGDVNESNKDQILRQIKKYGGS